MSEVPAEERREPGPQPAHRGCYGPLVFKGGKASLFLNGVKMGELEYETLVITAPERR